MPRPAARIADIRAAGAAFLRLQNSHCADKAAVESSSYPMAGSAGFAAVITHQNLEVIAFKHLLPHLFARRSRETGYPRCRQVKIEMITRPNSSLRGRPCLGHDTFGSNAVF